MIPRRAPWEIEEFLERHKYKFDLLHVYLGKEPNTFHKKWTDDKLKILLPAVWRYEDFRGNQTMPLLYQMLNEWRDDIIVERAHFPNTEKDYKLFCQYKIPIFSLESKHDMRDFDIVATSLSFLPPWINFPLMLNMSGIPPLWKDRDPERKTPLIMVGGSAMYGNFSVAYPVVDMIYLGDAEEEEDGGLFSLLSAIEPLMKEHNLTIEELVQIVQKDCDYIFCPSLYQPVYKKERFIEWRPTHRSGIGQPVYPMKLRRRICKDLDKAPAYTKPIPSYTDTTMGLGEIEVSRGCRGVCSFCGIGWKYRPYRERSKDVMVKHLVKNRKEGGGVSLCPIATEFAWYSEKRGLVNELAKHSRFVDPLSMRVDAFASDEEFASYLGKRGMNQLALGVEGVSQRLRNRLRKGVTEEEILKACRIAIERGFKRIKFFMISNIDEEWKDFEEFFALIRKVNIFKKQFNRNIQLKASWTPLFVEPCTPLQWKKPTIEQRQDWNAVDDILVGEKVYGTNMKFARKNNGLGVEFALGIKNEMNFLWMMQGMHLGDTRFAEAVVKAAVELGRPFYVSFGRTTRDIVTRMLKQTGGSWSYIMRERAEDEVFPWDIVDRGVPKSSLLRLYQGIKLGYYDEVSKATAPPPLDDAPLINHKSDEQAEAVWYLFKFFLLKQFENVPNTHWRAQFHRAAWKAGLPISVNKVHFVSDRDNRNWFGGKDYVGIAFSRELTEKDLRRIDKMGKYLVGIVLAGHKKLAGRPKWQSLASRYQVETDVDILDLRKLKREFESAEEVTIKQPETRYFSGVRYKLIQIKPQEDFSIAISSRGLRTGFLDVILTNSVDIRPFLYGFLKGVSPARIRKFPINKVELLERTRIAELWREVF